MWMKIKMAYAIILKPARAMSLPEEVWPTAEAMEEDSAEVMALHTKQAGAMHTEAVTVKVTDGEADLEEARLRVWAEAREGARGASILMRTKMGYATILKSQPEKSKNIILINAARMILRAVFFAVARRLSPALCIT
jgi:hypothetical protein